MFTHTVKLKTQALTKAECRSMSYLTSELLLIQQLLYPLKFNFLHYGVL